MTDIFRRTELAEELARQLLAPGVLDTALRSGLFLSGLRRTGKTTFLVHDLIPALQAAGALVIYVDLWTDTKANPASLIHEAIRTTLAQLESPGSRLLAQIKRVAGADVGALTFKLGLTLETLGTPAGPTLAHALTEVIDKARVDVVLIVDEVQQALGSEDGNRMLYALKAARDAINPRPGTPGHFLFLGTGSHRSLVNELTTRRAQAFSGAVNAQYPMLGRSYVEHVLERLRGERAVFVPSIDIAVAAFEMLGHRPEEFLKALRQLNLALPAGADADQHLPVIARTLRSSAADVELARLDQIGSLARVIFDRIAQARDGARGLFSGDAAADYSAAIGRQVRVDEIQPVVNELVAMNLVMRSAHGVYEISDPFVREIWLENQLLR